MNVQEQFSAMLAKRFPIGAPESSLIHELWIEGFKPKSNWTETSRDAVFNDGSICPNIGDISWWIDGNGHVTKIIGNFSHNCS